MNLILCTTWSRLFALLKLLISPGILHRGNAKYHGTDLQIYLSCEGSQSSPPHILLPTNQQTHIRPHLLIILQILQVNVMIWNKRNDNAERDYNSPAVHPNNSKALLLTFHVSNTWLWDCTSFYPSLKTRQARQDQQDGHLFSQSMSDWWGLILSSRADAGTWSRIDLKMISDVCGLWGGESTWVPMYGWLNSQPCSAAVRITFAGSINTENVYLIRKDCCSSKCKRGFGSNDSHWSI